MAFQDHSFDHMPSHLILRIFVCSSSDSVFRMFFTVATDTACRSHAELLVVRPERCFLPSFSRVLGVGPLGRMAEGLRSRKTELKLVVTRIFIVKRTSLANFSHSRVLCWFSS